MPPAPTNADVSMEPQTARDSPLAEGIRGLYAREELCDVVLVAGEKKFPVHKAMLAAMSGNFCGYLRHLAAGNSESEDPMQGMLSRVEMAPAAAQAAETPAAEPAPAEPAAAEGGAAVADADPAAAGADASAPAAPAQEEAAASPSATSAAEVSAPILELQVGNIESSEALFIMLSYVYTVGTGAPWEYKPPTAEVNRDILKLARHFGLPHLHEHAARWLTGGLTTANVVGRLVTCEELGLGLLREKMLERLAANAEVLTQVSSSPEIMTHPRILQDLLFKVASRRGAPATQGTEEASDKVEQKAEKAEEKQPEEPKAEKIQKTERVEKQPKKAEIPVAEKRVADKPPAKRIKRGAGGA